MDINIVEDKKDIGFLELGKLAMKIDNSSNGIVNKLDIESLDEAIPGIFIDESSGWSFKHLPNGVSSIDDRVLSGKLISAKVELDNRLQGKLVGLIEELGLLTRDISKISFMLGLDGLSNIKTNILLGNISKLHIRKNGVVKPLIGTEDSESVDLTRVRLSKGETFEIVESKNPELNFSIQKLNTTFSSMVDISLMDTTVEDEYNGVIIKKFLEKDRVTTTDIITILSQPSDFLDYLSNLYGKILDFISRAKEVSVYNVEDKYIPLLIDLDDRYSELSLIAKDRATISIVRFIDLIKKH